MVAAKGTSLVAVKAMNLHWAFAVSFLILEVIGGLYITGGKRGGFYVLAANGIESPKLLLLSAVCASLTAMTAAQVQAPVELKVGDVAPDFTLKYFDGKDL